MNVSPRAYLTSGIAVLGAGAIALTPIQPLPDHLAAAPQHAVESLAVNLAASIDPITPWVDTFKTSFANVQTLLNFYLEKPFPLLQTIGANIGTYFKELTNGQAALIPEQISANLKAFFQAPWDPGAQSNFGPLAPSAPDPTNIADGEYISSTEPATGNAPEALYAGLRQELVQQAFTPACQDNGDCLFVKTASILNFLNTPYSGQLVGLAGVLLSPVVQLVKSFTAVGEFLKTGDVLGAINELINIPANTTNAFLNGAGYLDLTAIVSQIAPLPVTNIGLNLGGLLNSMPFNGSLKPQGTPPTLYSGGVGIDSVATAFGPIEFPGLPNGWGGSVIGLGQFLGQKMLVTPPAPGASVPAAAAAPKVAAAVPAAAAAVEAPAALVEAPAPVSEPDIPAALSEAPAKAPAAVADTTAPAHRGGGNSSDNGGTSGGHGHRGAA